MTINHIKSPAHFGADMLTSLGSAPNPRWRRAGAVVESGMRIQHPTAVSKPAPGNQLRDSSGVPSWTPNSVISLPGRATFLADDGQTLEFAAGDAAYFPPFSRGTWIIHETLRKTYVVWRNDPQQTTP